MAQTTVARKPGEGTAWWLLGGLYEVKVTGEETGGAMTVMEITVPAGMGPPPHTHDGSEVVYVLEGTVAYHIAGETVEGGPGAVFHLAPGTVEWFEPAGEAVRVLVVYAPGGVDRFFAEVGEPAAARTLPPPPATPPDLPRVAAAAARYGMRIQPPAR